MWCCDNINGINKGGYDSSLYHGDGGAQHGDGTVRTEGIAMVIFKHCWFDGDKSTAVLK